MIRILALGTAGVVAGLMGGVLWSTSNAGLAGREPSTELLGQTLGDLTVRTSEGRTLTIGELIDGEGAMLAFLNAEDCLSCANLPLEAKVLENVFDGFNSYFFGLGPDTLQLGRFFRKHRVRYGFVPSTDEHLAERLGPPAVVIVSAAGQILFVDRRSGPRSRAAPISRVLPALVQTLNGSKVTTEPP